MKVGRDLLLHSLVLLMLPSTKIRIGNSDEESNWGIGFLGGFVFRLGFRFDGKKNTLAEGAELAREPEPKIMSKKNPTPNLNPKSSS